MVNSVLSLDSLLSQLINIELNKQTSDDKRFKTFALIAINIVVVVVVVVHCRFVVLFLQTALLSYTLTKAAFEYQSHSLYRSVIQFHHPEVH